MPPNVSENEEFDHKKNAQRLHAQRLKALREIWEQGGFEDVSALLEKVGQEYLIGHCMTEVLAGQCEAVEFVKSCLRAATRDTVYRSCLTGFLGNVGTGLIAAIINEIECACKPDTFLTLLLCMPFGATPWRYLDKKPTDFRDAYWKRVEPRIWIGVHGEEEINESIGSLLAVRRVSVAFRVACVAWDQVETSQLIRLLHAMPTADLEDFLKDPLADYYISEAFDELDKRTGVTVEEKAQLEYAHFTLLDRSEHGIPNLEKQIATSPGLYAWAIACVFKRVGGGEDPPELRFSNPERRSELARVARQLLDRIRRLPGTDRKKNIDAGELKAWIGEVRLLCARHDRTTIGDHMIGQFLARAPADDDGVWPCRPVCEALEWMASEEIDHGFQIGTKKQKGCLLESALRRRRSRTQLSGALSRLVPQARLPISPCRRCAGTYRLLLRPRSRMARHRVGHQTAIIIFVERYKPTMSHSNKISDVRIATWLVARDCRRQGASGAETPGARVPA